MQLGFAVPPNDHDEVHLGHTSPQWSNWDGGKIGGRPSWLNPRDVPREVLRCRGPCKSSDNKGTPLCFIAQLYCPADDIREEAFHRSIYVFVCPKCCSGSSELMRSTKDDAYNLSDCVQILRCQLPKQNEFYPTEGNSGEEWDRHTSQYWAKKEQDDKLNLCAVCGQRSKGKCPKQNKWFCCPDHQKEHLRAVKKSDDTNAKYLPSMCYESELIVEDEPQASEEPADVENDMKQKAKKSLFEGELTDADSNLEQSDLNAMTLSEATTGVTDPTTLAFYARMAIGGEENDVRDQCLRYSRWPETKENEEQEDDADDVGPLWLASENQPPSKTNDTLAAFPPPCQYCGAARAFEFQILPQMLHYLFHAPESTDANGDSKQILTEAERAILLEAASKIESGVELPPGFREQHEKALAKARDALLGVSNSKEASGGSFEWGTIAIYTCTASCGDGDVALPREFKGLDITEKDRLRVLGAYREEVAWVQPSLD